MRARRFTLADQHIFAALSGDYNPLHLDPLVARRLLVGGATVHGIHLVLWALDQLRAEGVDLPSLARLRVHFDRAVRIGDLVTLGWNEAADGRILARLTGDTGTFARLNLTSGGATPFEWQGATRVPELACEEHDIDALAARSGELTVALPAEWIKLFPHLAQFRSDQIAILLATTRLVGMLCPGLHSIYSALQLGFGSEPIAGTLHYRVVRADKRVRLVDMEVSAQGVTGSISTLLRPKPYAQPSLSAVRSSVSPTAFAGQRALVIGGSRGLGELTAKLLAVGGAHVSITYVQGAAEAAAVVAEANNLGLLIDALHFDVAAPPAEAPIYGDRFTHLYFFATPLIPAGHPGRFSSANFARLVDCYVDGLARTVEWFIARAIPTACVCYPSTTFLDQPDAHFPEYIAAKACGEELCAHLADQLAPLRIVVERLPRLPTDQTQALTELALSDGVTTLRDALLRCATGVPQPDSVP